MTGSRRVAVRVKYVEATNASVEGGSGMDEEGTEEEPEHLCAISGVYLPYIHTGVAFRAGKAERGKDFSMTIAKL